MKRDLLVIGGGGHAKVVIDIALCSGDWQIAGVLDDARRRSGSAFWVVRSSADGSHCGVLEFRSGLRRGHRIESVRERLQSLRRGGIEGGNLGSPVCDNRAFSRDWPGSVVMAGAVITQRHSRRGDREHRALIDHDCVLGDYCHIAPGVSLCGGFGGSPVARGVGAAVIPGVSIGSDCVIGAGAAVVRSVRSDALAVGVPAHLKAEQ
jgi:UDP-perosamine 4-acetyltransferase